MTKKINVGIVGYGNLGKAVEQTVLKKSNLNLVAIFSRRQISSPFKTKVEQYQNFINYKGKIDVMILCGGSKSDLEEQSPEIAKHFDIINTFDTHKKITTEFAKIDKIAKTSGTRAIISCGWDPGLFSIVRALFMAVAQDTPTTIWGKGISMGHSDALRRVKGVEDAVQFTVPNVEALKLLRQGKHCNLPLHNRECFIAAENKAQTMIEKEIKNIDNYFKGQPTFVHFVSKNKVQQLKKKMYHKGEVFSNFLACNNLCQLNFKVKMQSNPFFTASIVCTFITAIINLKSQNKSGAYTALDIAPSMLFLPGEQKELLKTLC